MVSPAKVLLPTAYFPPVSYFIHITHFDIALIEQMETFPKQTFRNRCEIMTSAGRLNLIVPVIKPNGNHTITKDVEICYREPWQGHQWKTLMTAYRSSPYFNYYADIIKQLFETDETSLLQHNFRILKTITSLLSISLSMEYTVDYIKNPEDFPDLRSEFSPKKRQRAISFLEYPQVFGYKKGFIADLSILDLLFNMGPEAGRYVRQVIGH